MHPPGTKLRKLFSSILLFGPFIALFQGCDQHGGDPCIANSCGNGNNISDGGTTNDGSDGDTSTGPVCVPTGAEVCDGIDNNCNGFIDEGLLNACGTCGPVPAETCDGVDNNCNGTIDEGCDCQTGALRPCGKDLGQCKSGLQSCLNGEWGMCSGVGPSSEICDGADNNCDGLIDEGLLNACGKCGPIPAEYCDGLDNNCDGIVDNGLLNACGLCGPVPAEICDGNDNNCNGTIDEGCPCLSGLTQPCGTNLGECSKGTQTCVGGTWGNCSGVGPSSEICDGLDNDCDGDIDEGVKNACGTCGPVPPELCDGIDNNCDGHVDEGLRNACGTCGPVPAEICDGIDNDCNGTIDEGCPCTAGIIQNCGVNLGQCTSGQQTCIAGHWSTCSGIGPSVEICDGKDNNCDGHADEGLLNACGTCGPVPAEVCDGLDNNCDGRIDEGLLNACGKCGPIPAEVCDGLDNNCNGVIDEGLLNACGTCGPVPAEICDGVDNNCNGKVDEGCPCITGLVQNCGINLGTCTTGTQACVGGVWTPCSGIGPSVEICDGKDNNCDGHADEGLLNACGTCGPLPAEICDGLDNNCDGHIDEGLRNACGSCGPVPVEICDGIDNDCDGTIDEGCGCMGGAIRPCGQNLGICTTGTQACVGGSWTLCSGIGPSVEICDGKDNNCNGQADENLLNACGTCGPIPAEICDGIDNDCDGDIDEGCPCTTGLTQNCGTTLGLCISGTQTCIAGHWGSCSGTSPAVEICDGKDNNCDGHADEGLLNACGICGPLPVEICDGIDNNCDGHVDEGLRNACGLCGPVPAEICDGIDNDCDGTIDEGCTCMAGAIRSCGSSLGQCTLGNQSCVGGQWSVCSGNPPSAEICDGKDNDCDGDIDEGVKNACGTCGSVPVEICDGIDNNCDGHVDEGLRNACGLCGPVPAEICDGVDNDCDGTIDEGCGCTVGSVRPCGQNLGQCTVGTQTCPSGQWSLCTGVSPSIEVCDGLDNNCDGIIDNGLKNACGTCGPTPPEKCGDGIDNNCNGLTDEPGCI